MAILTTVTEFGSVPIKNSAAIPPMDKGRLDMDTSDPCTLDISICTGRKVMICGK
jgi:hypothetical protein